MNLRGNLIFLLVSILSLSAFAQPPAIVSFFPSEGPVGTLITITGNNLNNVLAFNVGGASAIEISNDGTTLVGMVMPGATTGSISVVTTGGATSSAGNYSVTSTYFPASQQGSKLVGTGSVGNNLQGYSTAISGDGNTVIIGAPDDNSAQGAAFVYTRSGGAWSQQAKLIGTGNTGLAQLGISVALSADGNTALVGGYVDNSNEGATWVFVRSGGVWTQQGAKLVGTGAATPARQGSAVSLSADGNTALIGGSFDNFNQGAVWVFVRSGVTWTQQGSKLVGTGNAGAAGQGSAVALSADGNTAAVGGTDDNSLQGAVWMFVRSAGVWSQQGSKVVGTGNIGAAFQGSGVALSADGNTMICGGYNDNAGIGAAWVFTRAGLSWTQQTKLIGTGNTGPSGQGYSVSLSADGNTAFVGGNWNNANRGSNWVFTRATGTWTQQGNPLTGTGGNGSSQQGYFVGLSADGGTAVAGGFADNSLVGAAWIFIPSVVPVINSISPSSGSVGTSVTISGINFNTTSTNNIVYFGATQAIVNTASATSLTVTVPTGATFDKVSVLNGSLMAYSTQMFLPTYSPTKSSISASDVQNKVDFSTAANPHTIAVSDIDGDGKSDILVANFSSSDLVSVYRNTASNGSINAGSFAAKVDFTSGSVPYGIATGDIDGDGKPDIVLTNRAGSSISILRNTSTPGAVAFATKIDFTVGILSHGVAIGDIDRDGKPDIVVTNATSNTVSVLRNISTTGNINMETKVDFVAGIAPYAVSIGDFDGDGKADILVSNAGSNSISVFRNTSSSGAINLAGKVDFSSDNTPISTAVGDIDGDGKLDVLVANFGGNNVSVFRNTSSTGSVSFATRDDFTSGTEPSSVVLTDYDGDGLADIVASNTNSNTLSIYRNTSTSGIVSLVSKVDIGTGVYPATIGAGDVDGDGLPDLVTANYNSTTISVFRNNSANYTFYSSAAGASNLQDLNSWGVAPDGSGSNPTSFSNSSYTFQLANEPTNLYNMAGNLTIAGKLNVPASATLNTGGFNLTVGDNMVNDGLVVGSLSLNGSSVQTLSGTGGVTDLFINNPAGVSLGGNTSISNSLNFTSGKLSLGAFSLTLSGVSSTINGANTSSYIVTDGAGSLTILDIGTTGRTGNVAFPVGNSTYNPVLIDNAGTLDGFSVRVLDDVYDAYSGSTPTGASHAADVVDRTWLIDEQAAGGSNVTLTLQWNATDELTGFTRGDCNVAHYTGGQWVANPVSTAASGADPYVQTLSSVTSFSPFGIHNNGGPLPVEWLSFTGKKVFDNVQLNWTTATETNNSHFEVERSKDGRNFEQVGEVKGSGNSHTPINYNYTDVTPFGSNRVLYYRLKQVDFNGEYDYSKTIAVSNNKQGNGVTIEAINPNPFTEKLNLTLNNVSEGNVTIEVYDLSGRKHYTQTTLSSGQGTLSIDLSSLAHLAKGVYIVNIKNGNDAIQQKLVKVR